MKNIRSTFAVLMVLAIVVAITSSGCLKLQTNSKRSTTDTLDAHLYKTAWAYLKSRAYNNATPADTGFRRMYDAIIYSGLDTNEYIKPNRTFIYLSNAAAKLVWSTVFTSAGKAATSWKSYSAADVKTYLQYLILTAQYSHYNLPVYDVTAQTLAPVGSYATVPVGFKIPAFVANPNSTMTIKVLDASVTGSNTADYPITLNGSYYVATSDLLATNGVVDVMNVYLSPNPPQ